MKKMMFAAAAAVLCAPPLMAQAVDTVAPLHRNLITANPIGILADYYNVEFERALSDVVSISLAGERTTADDTDLTAGDIRFRYYPQARMFSGLALGASLGYASFVDEDEIYVDTRNEPTRRSGPTIGLEVDYSWLVGRDRRLYIGVGFGLRRVLSGGDDNDDSPTLIPGGRYFGIGYTF